MIGIQTLGGIHSCACDTAAPPGFTCPTIFRAASLLNAGDISLIGISYPNSRGNNPEAGSALVIGGSIDGGFVNYGPGTSNNVRGRDHPFRGPDRFGRDPARPS